VYTRVLQICDVMVFVDRFARNFSSKTMSWLK